MRPDATWKGHCLCITPIEATREELPDSRLGASSSHFCLEDLAPLLVRGKMQGLHRLQKLKVHLYSEEAKS